ncbi:N-acetylglutamate synthase [Neisseria arctica]|uniref:Amino-acid acetyltransferase n=1 Tax=Neisseria arctica TaxID=1470200 RepID=A0A0J0YSS1_9NEIS|nr:amino-acid N-acetyltransferase [Neisseria arctica]KLT73142.1 N-acetylglutamate synthase [Neisseria arctica]UOO87127.1 amino-acid N-acetyltransferase [Neisseria arctica]
MSHSEFFVPDFREAAPYINYLRGKTLVIGISSTLLEGATLRSIASDLNLLASLGVKLVVVHGSRSQINSLLEADSITPEYYNNRRITDETTLIRAKQASGMLRYEIEAALAVGIAPSPYRNKPLRTAGGNMVSARPLGVIDGIDMGYTGRIRKIDTEAIRQYLDNGTLVLISPLGYSLSGKTFNLSMGDIAEAVAIALAAEKLIYLTEQEGILDKQGLLLDNLSAREAQEYLNSDRIHDQQRRLIGHAINAVENGVSRTQILSGLQDGSLIRELFTRHGAGTSIARNPFINIRQATSSDIAAIITLIRPLEESGVLLRRSREYLENHISEFSVLEHDGHIYGCVILKTFDEAGVGELACLVVSPEAQDSGYGELLLEHLINQAKARGIHTLFALSTHTGEWFIERGFQTASVDQLPTERRREYDDSGRKSKVFVYRI